MRCWLLIDVYLLSFVSCCLSIVNGLLCAVCRIPCSLVVFVRCVWFVVGCWSFVVDCGLWLCCLRVGCLLVCRVCCILCVVCCLAFVSFFLLVGCWRLSFVVDSSLFITRCSLLVLCCDCRLIVLCLLWFIGCCLLCVAWY